jgi:hypothetical protein
MLTFLLCHIIVLEAFLIRAILRAGLVCLDLGVVQVQNGLHFHNKRSRNSPYSTHNGASEITQATARGQTNLAYSGASAAMDILDADYYPRNSDGGTISL